MAGIYHNATLGLISLSSDGSSWITIADKNLGATEVQNSENITSTNGGKLYQRGNNYGFPRNASGISTSSSAVNASTYGPGNYYISSTFITVPSNTWDSSNNKNLRGGETGTYEAMQGPCTEGWHIPSIPDVNSLISILQSLGLLSSTSGSNTLTQAQYNVLCSSLKLYARKRISADDASLITDNGIQVVTSQIRGPAMEYGLLYISYTNNNYYWYKPSDTDVYNSSTGYGVPIRPFKNEAVIPDYNDVWDTLYGDELPDRPVIPVKKLKWLVNKGNYYYFKDAPTHASSITLNESSINLTTTGQTYQLTATVVPDDAIDKKVTRSSSDTTVATVSNTGLVTCVTPGSCTITATCDGVSATCSVIKYRTFTITRTEQSNMSSGWTYSDDAAGLTAGDGAFDDFFGYSAVLLNSSGVETAEMKQSGGVFTGAMTTLGNITSGDNVMIKFPVRGIKMSKSGSNVTLSITDEPNKTGYQYYAFTKGNEIKDKLYLGAYKITSGYKSLSGASPLVNTTRANFRSGVKSAYDSSAGTDRYSQITWYPRNYINALYMMKHGNPNSQSVVGAGYTGGSAVVNTGGTNSQTNATYGTSSNTQQAKLFGLEDRWGNAFEFLDGCWFNSSTQITVDKTNSVFQDSAYSTNLGAASSGWIGGIAGTNDGMFMNVNATGSGTTYYTDTFDAYANCTLLSGGAWGNSTYAGAFNVSITYPYSVDQRYGSRLMFL